MNSKKSKMNGNVPKEPEVKLGKREAIGTEIEEFEAEEINDVKMDDREFDDFSANDYSNAENDEFDDIENEDDADEEGHSPQIGDEEAPIEQGMLEIEKRIMEADTEYLNQRTQDILEKLNNSKTTKLQAGERVRLLIELKKLYCRMFSYSNELMEYIMNLFSPSECFAFLEMMETQRPVTIRVNTLKTQKASLVKSLTEKGVNMEPLDEVCKMAFKINLSKVPMGATPEYLAGHYMLQSAASMLPVRALAPQPGEFILDMAAAPGGKTTHIGQIMKNKGSIIANDSKKERTKALFYNCQRMGLTNVIVTNFDGRRFPTCLKKFDRVLLDAPCTGLGVISRDQSIKAKRTVLDIYRAAHLQRELLRKAIDLCKVGGYIVYSTCSFAVEENEAVVDYVCRKRFVKVVDTGLQMESKTYTKYKEHRYNDRIKYCVRVFPHIHNLDGFFIAKLLKTRDGIRGGAQEDEEEQNKNDEENNHEHDGSSSEDEKRKKSSDRKRVKKSKH